MCMGYAFDREPRYRHLVCYQAGNIILTADGVHPERQGDDLVFYHRYEKNPSRLIGAYNPSSGIAIVTSPEQRK